MPNTLAHLVVGVVTTKPILPKIDYKWIFLGAIIPDLPWIGQRLVRSVFPDLSSIDVRLYAAIQSALFASLLLCAAFALLSRTSLRVFAALSIGVIVHLLLDATQTKWGNGVLFFAPGHWEVLNLGLYWPEHWITVSITLLGAAVGVFALIKGSASQWDLIVPGWSRFALIIVFLLAYACAPLPFLAVAERSNLHFANTLRQTEERVGRPIEVDRRNIEIDEAGVRLMHWTGENFFLHGTIPDDSDVYSVKGKFILPEAIEVTELHRHQAGLRDYASYVGLLLVMLVWVRALFQRRA